MVDRAHLEIDGLEAAECALDLGQALVGDLREDRLRIAGVALEDLGRDRAALGIGQESEDDLWAIEASVSRVANADERTAASLGQAPVEVGEAVRGGDRSR